MFSSRMHRYKDYIFYTNVHAAELHGYKPVSSELAKSEKKKLKLKFSEDGSYERMELVKLWYSRMYVLVFSDPL